MQLRNVRLEARPARRRLVRLDTGFGRELRPVGYAEPPFAEHHDSVRAQSGERAADVHGRQPERIADVILAERKQEAVAFGRETRFARA